LVDREPLPHVLPDPEVAQFACGVHAVGTPDAREKPTEAVVQVSLVVSPLARHADPEVAQPVCAVHGVTVPSELTAEPLAGVVQVSLPASAFVPQVAAEVVQSA